VKAPRAALLALGLLLAAPAAWAITDPAEMLPDRGAEQRAERIGHELRCLVCQNESIEDSGADLARDLRRVVRTQVSAGRTDAEVMAWMEGHYGDFVRLNPRFGPATLLLWGAPLLALLAGGGAAWWGLRRRSPAVAPLSAEERARLGELGLARDP
jgi:cytochrome c-type biogenesis protein CcmH